MKEKQQTQQEKENVQKKRKIRNQIIVYIGAIVFIAIAIVPGVRYLLQERHPQQETAKSSQIQQGTQQNGQLPPEDQQEIDLMSPLQHAEKLEQVLAKMRPTMVTLKGSEDGVSYSVGSGFIMEIKEDILYICTCRHTIENLDSWEVTFHDGTTAEGIRTGTSQIYDVGIVEVSLEQLPRELLQSLFAVSIDLDHWSGLEGKKAYAGFISMYQEEGSDSYMTGPLLDILADFPWGDLSHSEFQIAFTNGDSGSAIFDEEGLLIAMVLGTSFEEDTEVPRRWGVPLSGIMTCYTEIINQKGGM